MWMTVFEICIIGKLKVGLVTLSWLLLSQEKMFYLVFHYVYKIPVKSPNLPVGKYHGKLITTFTGYKTVILLAE